MRNFKALISLAVITIAALLAAVLYRPHAVTLPATEVGPLLPGLSERLDKIQKITILHAGEAVTLNKQKDAWTVAEKASYPAVKDQVRELLMGLAQAQRVESKTRNKDNYAALGLSDPDKSGSEASRVELFDQAGKSIAKVVLGKRKPAATETGRSDFYALVKDDPQTWLVEGRMPAIGAAGAWLSRTLLELERNRIAELTLTHSDGEVLRLKPKASDQTGMTLEGLKADEKLQNDYALDDMADRLSLMQMEDVQPADKLKWPQQPDLQIDARTKDGLLVRIVAAKIDNQTWLRLTADAATPPSSANDKDKAVSGKSGDGKETKPIKAPQQEAATLNARWNGWAYTLADWAYQALSKHRADLVTAKGEATATASDASPSNAASATEPAADPESSATAADASNMVDLPDDLVTDTAPPEPAVESNPVAPKESAVVPLPPTKTVPVVVAPPQPSTVKVAPTVIKPQQPQAAKPQQPTTTP